MPHENGLVKYEMLHEEREKGKERKKKTRKKCALRNYFSSFIYYLNFVCLFNATMNTNNGNKTLAQCEVRNAMSPFNSRSHHYFARTHAAANPSNSGRNA